MSGSPSTFNGNVDEARKKILAAQVLLISREGEIRASLTNGLEIIPLVKAFKR